MLAEYSDAWASSEMYSEEIYRCSPTIGVIVREYCWPNMKPHTPRGCSLHTLKGSFVNPASFR